MNRVGDLKMIISFFRKFLELLKNKFKSESAVKSVFLLAGGTAIGQAIYVFVTPILSRLYSPADFGVLAIYMALLSILGAFTSLSYHLAIPLPKEDVSAINILALSCLVHVGVVCSLALFIYFKASIFLVKWGWGAITPYLWLFPLGVFFMGLYRIMTYFALRFKAYPAIARTKVTQKIFGAMTSIFMGVMGLTPSGLLWGHIVGLTFGIPTLFRNTINQSSLKNISKNNMVYVAKEYISFPLYRTWGTMLDCLSVQITPLLLSSFFSPSVTGWFAMSMRVLQLPASFLGQSIGQVYYQRAVVAQRENQLAEMTLQVFKTLLTFGTFPILSLGFIAPVLFPLLLGREWEIAGYYTLFLAPYLWMQFVSSPISSAFLILNRQRFLTIFQGFMLLASIFSLWIGSLFKSTYTPIIIYSACNVIVYFLYLLIIMNLIGEKLNKYVGQIIRELFAVALLVVPMATLYFFSKSAFLRVSAWCFSCMLYAIWVLWNKLR